jgi:hypothetical protein
VRPLSEVLRRKHLTLVTERSSRAWLKRSLDYLKRLRFHLPGEQKVERFLTPLAKNGSTAQSVRDAELIPSFCKLFS